MGDWLLERWRGDTAPDIDEIAERLGGEANGNWITAPHPGRPSTDRSLKVRINPARPMDFYVYSTSVPLSVAKAHVRAVLELTAPVEADAAERKAKAKRLWDQTVSGVGTLVESYLRSRAITLPAPPTLHFHGQLRHWGGGGYWPAMIAAVTDKEDHFLGVHVTWLDGRRKAPVDPVKMSLGPINHGAIRLGEPGPAILIGEGIETSMSGTLLDREHRPAWSAVSEGGMARIHLPSTIRRVTFLADADDDGQSVKAAKVAKSHALKIGIDARVAIAPAGQDFNDQLVELAKGQGRYGK